jgi:outer membrane protein insertion porin family
MCLTLKKIRKYIKTIQRFVEDKGYALARIYPDVAKDDTNKKVSLNIKIDSGEKVYINDVIISGNHRTIDRVIRREVYLASGDLYSKTDFEDSKKALQRTGYFSKVDIDIKEVAQNQINLIINVEESPTGSLSGGIGYGSADGMLLNAKVSDRNVFGSGIEVGIDFEYSSRTTTGKAYFHNPRLNDSVYSLGGSAYSKKYDNDDYKEDVKGFDLTVGRKLTRNVYASVTLSHETSDIFELPDSLKKYYSEGTTIKNAVRPVLSYNSTDDYYTPRSGIKASTGFEYANFGGDEKFLKTFASFATFYGLEDYLDYDLILRFKTKVAFLQDRGHVSISEKYYLGGLSSIRGFDYSSVAPQDSDGDRIGGNRYYTLNLEASIPLIDDARMRLIFFLDHGGIGTGNYDIKRSSVGTGIEWFSPMGPLQFIFAKPLNKKTGDRTSVFEFMIGRTF